MIASFFSPSTASETSLATNEDWFALLDLGDGEESTSVLNRMSWGENRPEPQFGPPFELLPSAAQIVPDSWGCGIEQLWARYAATSAHLYDTSAAFAALDPYQAGLQATCPQSNATSLYLDASALAEVNSLDPPVIPASANSSAIVAVASEMNSSRIQSSGTLVKTKSAAARKETRQARGKIPAAPMAQRISEHDGTSSDGNTILADLSSQPASPGARGQTSTSIFAVPLIDASLTSGESAGPVPNQQCTGRRSGPAESKPPPKRRPKSKVGPRLLCHQPGCGKTFSSQHNLNEHRQVHEYPRVQRYFCREDQCALETKGFNFKRDLTRHYRQKHPWVAEKLKKEAARQVEEMRAAVARKKAAMAAARAAARERVAAFRKEQKISFRVENEANESWSGIIDSEMQMIDGR
ncbi:C2H2-type domain-containing protein [Pseudozyma hubeiensis]|nr:C2H2-type domain-containing protein [Pseudozyma hubeiensis]